MKVMEGLKYTKTHEWVRIEGAKAYIGITDYAQEHLGEIVFVDLPEAGADAVKGQELVAVESVKAVSDTYSPVTGTVTEVNEELLDNPALLNESPYETWIAAVEMSDATETEDLLTATDYEKICEEE